MTQENVNVDVPISMDDIRTVLNKDAKFALQVQNAALNRTVLELTTRLDTAMGELGSTKTELEKVLSKDTKGNKGG